jgi:hypothetical protein
MDYHHLVETPCESFRMSKKQSLKKPLNSRNSGDAAFFLMNPKQRHDNQTESIADTPSKLIKNKKFNYKSHRRLCNIFHFYLILRKHVSKEYKLNQYTIYKINLQRAEVEKEAENDETIPKHSLRRFKKNTKDFFKGSIASLFGSKQVETDKNEEEGSDCESCSAIQKH